MASNRYSTREREREREIKLLPQTHSPEVDYSLLIMVAVLMMLERVEMQPGTAPAVFPPPIFAGYGSVLCISYFSAASSRERPKESLYRGF